MDRDYFQHVEEAYKSTVHVASRTIALAAYGIVGVYVLLVVFPSVLPTVMSDVLLPRMNDDYSSMDMMANDSREIIFTLSSLHLLLFDPLYQGSEIGLRRGLGFFAL